MAFGNKQSGSSAFVAVASLASLAVAFIFAQESAVRNKQAVDQSKVARAVEEKNVGAMSALGHYKSLVSSKKIGAVWKPAIFAENYFDQHWAMREATGVSGEFKQLNGTDTSIRIRPSALDEAALKSVMQSSKPIGKENFTIKFIAPNFDPDNERVVKSIDIEVSERLAAKKETMKVFARVPLPRPSPYDPKLMFRKPGASSWTEMKEKADLTEGPYEFIAEVSGIAFDGDLYVDGKKLDNRAVFGGRDSTGRVTHQAVNFENVAGQMGPIFTYDPAPEPDPEPAPAPKPAADTGGGGASTSDGTSCGFTKGSYGGAGSGGGGAAEPPPEPPAPTLPLTAKFKLVIHGASPGDEIPTEEMEVKIRKPPPPPPPVAAGGGGKDLGGRTLTAADYGSVCTAQCPYKGDDPGGGILGGYSSYEGQGPVSSSHSMEEGQNRWGIMTKKVCFVYPGAPHVAYDPHDSEIWAFDPATCKGEKLFKRGACGCLTGDTKILLGDGKTEKRIDEMNQWDRAWNPILKKSFAVRKYTAGPENKPLIQLTVTGQSIQATTDHPFLTTMGLKPASAISVGDKIRRGEGWEPVTAVTQIPVPDKAPTVWNLELEGPDDDLDSHYVVANGIVTGDLLIQNKLKKDPQLGSIPGSKLD